MRTITNLAIGIALSANAFAAPLDKNQVSTDAKWLLHVDVDGLSQSQVGSLAIDHAKKEYQKNNRSALSIDFDAALAELKSITLYGSSFEEEPDLNSVAVIETGSKAQSIIDAWLLQEELNSPPGKAKFEQLADMPFPTYLFAKEVYLSMPRNQLMIISKSFDQIQKALGVIDGKRPGLEHGDSKLKIVDQNGFFLIASAEGLNAIKQMPAEARILQKATGAQIAIGEKDGDFLTNIILSAQDETVASQLYRIVQGMIALVSFAQVENQSLEILTRSTEVSFGKDFVSIDLRYSAERIIALAKPFLDNLSQPRRGSREKEAEKTAPHEVVVDDETGGRELRVLNVDARSDNGNLPFFAIDGDPDTFWASQGRGQWIRFYLESPSLVREIQIAWRHGDERRTSFHVETSADGAKWTNLIERKSSGTTAALESYNIPDAATRWIRLNCNANNKNPMNTISDIRFLGEPGYAPPESPSAE